MINLEVDGRVECFVMVARTTLEKNGYSGYDYKVGFSESRILIQKSKQNDSFHFVFKRQKVS